MRVAVNFNISSKYVLEPYIFYLVPHSQFLISCYLLFIYLFTDALLTSEYNQMAE
jgi:hypothetical protein